MNYTFAQRNVRWRMTRLETIETNEAYKHEAFKDVAFYIEKIVQEDTGFTFLGRWIIIGHAQDYWSVPQDIFIHKNKLNNWHKYKMKTPLTEWDGCDDKTTY